MNLFPFPETRDGQDTFMKLAKDVIRNKKSLLAHAPTGIGKTAAALTPSVEYAIDNEKTVIFVTPRHSQHRIAIETLQEMNKRHKAKIKAVDIIGKTGLCNHPETKELSPPELYEYCRAVRKDKLCAFYNNFWKKEFKERVAKKVKKISEGIMHAEDAKKSCGTFCAYEMLMDAAKKSNVIIADYYHVFHPSISASFFARTKNSPEDVILIVDEAHNLPARIRGLMSSSLSDFQLDRGIKEAGKFEYKELAENLKFIADDFLEFGKTALTKDETFVKRDDFVRLVEKTRDYDDFCGELEDAAHTVREEQRKSFLGGIASFLSSWKGDENGFTRIFRKIRGRHRFYFSLNFECLDSGLVSRDVLNAVHSSLLMSATLTPLKMYSELLGIESAEFLELESPFPKENRINLVLNDVTTKYTRRTEKEFLKYAKYLVKTINKVPGNVGVFFPSYELRNIIYTYMERSLVKDVLLETPGMSKEEKTDIFRKLRSLSLKGSVLLGVIGGSYSEGVDFRGDLMNAIVLVGLPLERPNLSTQALIDYYEMKFGMGWDYGYVFPSINRAIQASGRCIRSEKDKGFIVFMDERFLWNNYRKAMPKDMEFVVSKDIDKEIKEFFGK